MSYKEDKILTLVRSICRQRIHIENTGSGKKEHGKTLAAKAGDILEHIKMFTSENQSRSFANKHIAYLKEICVNPKNSKFLISLTNQLKPTMLRIQEQKEENNVFEIYFTFKLGEKLHSSNFKGADSRYAEYYIRDCSHSLASHGLLQLVLDLKHCLKDSTSIDILRKTSQLEVYAKDLLKRDLKHTVKFITQNKLVILYLIPNGQNEILKSAHDLIDFAAKINDAIQENKLLINTLC